MPANNDNINVDQQKEIAQQQMLETGMVPEVPVSKKGQAIHSTASPTSVVRVSRGNFGSGAVVQPLPWGSPERVSCQ